MRTVLTLLLLLHGVAHLVGFAVPWRLIDAPEMPYKTTVLAGAVEVGHAGARAVGALWLLAALLFAAVAVGLFLKAPWWLPLAYATALFSLALSVVGWPEARVGVALNLVLLGYLALGARLGWLDALR